MKTALFTALGLAALALTLSTPAHASDSYCREYQRRVTIGGKVQNSYGTACLQPDGSWKIVSEGAPQTVASVATEPVYEPQPALQPQPVVVYEEEPVFVPAPTVYRRYAPAPVWWGMNVSVHDWNHHGWHGNRWDRGQRYGYGYGSGHGPREWHDWR